MSIRKMITPTLLAIALFWSEGIHAQTDSLKNQLNVGLEFVTHGEICGGGLPQSGSALVNEKSSSFIFGRTRLIADYKRRGLQAYAVVQNSAVWGMSGNKALSLYEGWVKLSSKGGLFAQVGRIALSYDDERIIGPNDFAMVSLSHDVLRTGYEGHGHRLHVVLAYNQDDSRVYSGTYYVGKSSLLVRKGGGIVCRRRGGVGGLACPPDDTREHIAKLSSCVSGCQSQRFGCGVLP